MYNHYIIIIIIIIIIIVIIMFPLQQCFNNKGHVTVE